MTTSSRPPARRSRQAANRRQAARRLLLEGLERRELLAFDVLTPYATGWGPSDLKLAHINSDQHLDMVVARYSGIEVRLGNADGSFGEAIVTTPNFAVHSVVTGDFSGDGVTDLIALNDSGVGLLIGNGNGTFQAPQWVSLPLQMSSSIHGQLPYAQSAQSVATGDLNGDGKLDLVVGGLTSFPTGIGCGYYSCGYYYGYEGFVNVLLGNGSGGFTYADADPTDADLDAYRLGLYQTANDIAIADLNNDGKLDILTAGYYTGLKALLGNGTGAFGAPIHSLTNAQVSLSLADADGDGFLDTLSRSGSTLTVLRGQGDGRFVPLASAEMGVAVDSAVMGDVNGDGTIDLVAVGKNFVCDGGGYYPGYGYYCYSGHYNKLATVVLGDGQGGFSLPIVSSLGPASDFAYLGDATLASLRADGGPDLITIDAYAPGVIVGRNNGQWTTPVELDISDVSVIEGHAGTTTAVLTVTLLGNHEAPVSVDFATFDIHQGYTGYATGGVDFGSKSGTLVFAPGVLTQTIEVVVYGDRLGEGDEVFFVKLSNPQGALLRSDTAQVTILDDEPRISINYPPNDPLRIVEGDVGTTPAEFTVTLSQPYDQEVTVDYYTLTGHVNDIIPVSGTLRFAPGETSKPIVVQIVNDLIAEPDEAFNVILHNPTPNASIAQGNGYCLIIDNDPFPTVSINDVSVSEGNSGSKTMTFTLTLSAKNPNGVWVSYATANGTATTADKDYQAKSGSVYIDGNKQTATISITIYGDKKQETDEFFYVHLTSASGATIADGQGVGTILNDDGSKGGGNGKGNSGKGNSGKLLATALDAETTLTKAKKKK